MTNTRRLGPVTEWVLRTPERLYDWNAGWLLGHRFLRLTHVGRKSGRRYRTVLEVIGTDPASGELMVLVGQGRAADWYRNLQAAPGVEVAIGRRRFRPVHRELDEHEGATVLADFERRNRWAGPVIRTVLSRLVGRHYDGSDEARHQLIKERPVLAFGPADKSST